uniref:histidine kinase n=1 Tax=Phenylobacterium glaciei TaxID=2803784 RepID=A0A974P3C8_9CAUL|nr:sensor histidine kinase [Phenylobacterium glaciei]
MAGAATLIQDIATVCPVRADQVLPLSQIVSELVTNAFKYAHADGRAGVVLVRCGGCKAGGAQIDVVDDGPGLPPGFNPATDGGLGFRLIRALSRQVGATLDFGSEGQGLRVRVTVPRHIPVAPKNIDRTGFEDENVEPSCPRRPAPGTLLFGRYPQ